MLTWADRINSFNQSLDFSGKLPDGIEIMNPFRNNPEANIASGFFYRKYYSDQDKRYLILGINPGRLGSGHTGIPFTDTHRLQSACGISWTGKQTHEPSSVFMYDMIGAFGGPELFYHNFYISSICPLGFVKNVAGRSVNYNYYDDAKLKSIMKPWMITQLESQIKFGIRTDVVFCLGSGKNKMFIEELNAGNRFFGKVVALEHPRYIMQYKLATKATFIQNYLKTFREQGVSMR
jgi:uracil-DNA glycosylase